MNHTNIFGEPVTEIEHAKIERTLAILASVPFTADWVEYKGEIVFAQIDPVKSSRCGRPIVEVGYCATQVLVNQIIHGAHNYDPQKFRWCPLSCESWKPQNNPSSASSKTEFPKSFK